MPPTFLLSLLIALVALSVRASKIDEWEPKRLAPTPETTIATAEEDERDLGYYSKSAKSSWSSWWDYSSKSTKSSWPSWSSGDYHSESARWEPVN